MHPHDLLLVVDGIVADRPDRTFSLYEVFEQVCFTGSPHTVTGVRALITQELCVNALHPSAQRGTRIERLSRGQYRLLDDITLSSAAD
jgi:hypothetical protein